MYASTRYRTMQTASFIGDELGVKFIVAACLQEHNRPKAPSSKPEITPYGCDKAKLLKYFPRPHRTGGFRLSVAHLQGKQDQWIHPHREISGSDAGNIQRQPAFRHAWGGDVLYFLLQMMYSALYERLQNR